MKTCFAIEELTLTKDRQEYSVTPEPFNLLDLIRPFSFGLIPSTSQLDGHLLGQHTVRMSPISTAQLNPSSQRFCIRPSHFVLLPILLNNTNPIALRYSLTALEDENKVEFFELNAKDLRAIELSRVNTRSSQYDPTRSSHYDAYDEYDDDDGEEDESSTISRRKLQKTQSLVHIEINKPGVARLEGVVDVSDVDARIGYPHDVVIAPCPQVEFMEDSWPENQILCTGSEHELQIMIEIYGIPPLALRWAQQTNGKVEHLVVEGIDGERRIDQTGLTPQAILLRGGLPQKVQVPLTISPDTVGTYIYTLEEVSDGVGNVAPVERREVDLESTQTLYKRELQVLRRPAISFRHCGPGRPTPLLIGSETPVSMTVSVADPIDAPWDVELQYEPIVDFEDGSKHDERFKPWRKKISTRDQQRDLTLQANVPGEYTILGIKGRVRIVEHHLAMPALKQ